MDFVTPLLERKKRIVDIWNSKAGTTKLPFYDGLAVSSLL